MYESENPTGIDISEDPTLNIPSEPEISDDSENYKNSAKDAAKIQKSGKKYVENEILVKFRDEEGLTENLKEYARDKVHKKVGGTLKKDYKKSGQEGLHLVVVPEGVSVEEMIDEYQNDPSVEYAQPNYILSLPSSPIELNRPSGEIPATDYPDDTYFPLQWALSNSGQEVNGNIGTFGADIGILQAWDVTQGNKEVIIAVIDTGVDITHPDLMDNIWMNANEIPSNNLDDDNNGYIDDYQGFNFLEMSGDPADDNGHGTHCAGTIGASGNNGIGISGVTWNARVMPLKCLNAQGYGSTADAIDSIGYASMMGADIVSISWGCSEYDQALYEVISQSPALFVCAAGNSGQDNDVYPVYPANYNCENIISVAATGQDDELAGFSNWGQYTVDIGAPGVNIISNCPAWKGEPYIFMSGTSMAAPFVAGVAGLIATEEPGISPQELKIRILSSVDLIDSLHDKTVAGGRLNAANAFGSTEIIPAVQSTQTTVDVTPVPTLEDQRGSDTPSSSPINPDFLNYLNEDPVIFTTDGETGTEYGLGFSPSPFDNSYLTGMDVAISDAHILSYPSYYDLRTTEKVTSVKDQGPCGSCWAFATFGSLESVLLPGETWDFSENNLIRTHGFDYGPCEGGNYDMSAAYLARWSGPLRESDDPYWSTPSPTDLPPVKHVQEILFIPPKGGPLDNDNIKEAVMTYGGVSISFYWSTSYYNLGSRTYYYSGSANPNHGVVIVGWDDNKAVSGAPGPGAFIIKNSWGSGWGEGGYFYISYYDTLAGKDNAVFTAVPITNYDTIYQYDPLGRTAGVGYYSNTAWGANIFTAESDEMLNAVGFYTLSPNTEIQVYIYRNPTSGPINPAGYESTTSTTFSIPGYHTLELIQPVELSSGDRYSIVIRLVTPGYNYPIPVEMPIGEGSPLLGYSGGATANPGESYFSHYGSSWEDLTSSYANTNVCIKGYTEIGLPVPPDADFTALPETGHYPLNVQFTDVSTSSPTSWAWDIDGDTVTDYTTQNPVHTYEEEGLYTVSLTVENAYGSDSVTKVDYIEVTPPPPPPPFLDGWTYRKLHIIAGSPDGDLTDYQVRFVVHRTGGTDSGED
ncbi:MAG TPA: S8 family serine peptidase, partial [Methanoregulaceae archaeon]|nr:S8 family serine peptidase [Methanoregulaceae archaeon]